MILYLLDDDINLLLLIVTVNKIHLRITAAQYLWLDSCTELPPKFPSYA